jgi:indolepyruvate ferredoxin oxidoreductase
VVTVAQILATAAMFDGWEVRGLDQTGLSQKAGPVVSDVVLARPGADSSNLVGVGLADVVLSFDGLVAAADGVLAATDPDRTTVILSTSTTPTGAMVVSPDLPYPDEAVMQRLTASARSIRSLDAARLAVEATGQAATANLLVLGVALQAGAIPVGVDAVIRAVELNGVAVEANLRALDGGRRWLVEQQSGRPGDANTTAPTKEPETMMTVPPLPKPLGRWLGDLRAEHPWADPGWDLIELLAADLVGFGDAATAASFVDLVERTARAEQTVAGQVGPLTEAVARSRHKLTAYKDEYEVARLLLLPEAQAAAEAVGGRGARPTWHLHPPVLRALGLRRKIAFGPRSTPMLRALRAGKRLRGTRLDPFGRDHLRRIERALPGEFDAAIDRVLTGLDRDNLAEAVELAKLADRVRGYEDLKLARVAEYQSELNRRIDRFG